jgi:hypothetical protein
VFEFELAVDRDRVVDRFEDRPLLPVELEDAPPEGLVVLIRSKSLRRVRSSRQTRQLNDIGSEKVPVANDRCSRASVQSFHSHRRGLRIGCGSAQMSRLGSGWNGMRSSMIG